jgi:asparagine synthase (glutamine-hydrolysing)
VLPADVIHRRKRGFGAPIGTWFSRELAPLRSELVGERGLAGRGLFDGAAIRRICAEHDAKREDYSDLIMVLVNLEVWCRLFLDGASAADVGASLTSQLRAA